MSHSLLAIELTVLYDLQPVVSPELDQISKDSRQKQSRMAMIMLSTDPKSLSQTVIWLMLLLLPLSPIQLQSKAFLILYGSYNMGLRVNTHEFGL